LSVKYQAIVEVGQNAIIEHATGYII